MPAPSISPDRPATPRQTTPMLATVFLLLGTVGLGFGGWFYLRERMFLAHGVHVTGRVTNVQEEYDRKVGYTYRPDFEFTDASGKAYTNTALADTHPYHVGESVPVIYNPDSPTVAQIVTFWAAWRPTLAAGPFGLLFFATGVVCALPSLAAFRAAKGQRDFSLA